MTLAHANPCTCTIDIRTGEIVDYDCGETLMFQADTGHLKSNVTRHHFVQHFLRSGDYVQTEFTCTAPEGAACRMACWTCSQESREACQCAFLDETGYARKPDMRDFGYCLQLIWITEDAPEECYDGDHKPVRGPEPQPIKITWDGDNYTWDYVDD